MLYGQDSSAINADVILDAGLAKTSSPMTLGIVNVITPRVTSVYSNTPSASYPNQKTQTIDMTYAVEPNNNSGLGQRYFFVFVCSFSSRVEIIRYLNINSNVKWFCSCLIKIPVEFNMWIYYYKCFVW